MRRGLRWAVAAGVVVLLAALAFSAVNKRRAEQARATAPPAAAPVLELAAAAVARAVRTELTRTLEVSGSLSAVRSAMLKAKVAAEVREVLVREGETVKAGQLLVRLDDSEFGWRLRQAEDQAAGAKAQLDIAERTLENSRQLVNQGFISKNAVDTAVSNAESARASLQAARAAAELARKAVADTLVRSPIAGVVSQRLVNTGERAALDARLVEVVDLSQLEMEAAVAPEDVFALQPGAVAALRVDGAPAPVSARVARINPSTQAGTRAVLVYLAVDPGTLSLRQGMFARGSVDLQRQSALVVPASALRSDQARPYVQVLEGGAVRQRTVEPGTRGRARFDGGFEDAVAIQAGLKEGEQVLRGSVGALRDGTPARIGGIAPAPVPPAAAGVGPSASASAATAAR